MTASQIDDNPDINQIILRLSKILERLDNLEYNLAAVRVAEAIEILNVEKER